MEVMIVVDSFFCRKLLVRSGLARLLPSLRQKLNGGEDFLHFYSDRTLAVPVRLLTDDGLLPGTTTPDSINLAVGTPLCEWSIGRGADSPYRISAWGNLELRDELTTQFQVDHGVEHDSEYESLITHGGSGAYAAALDAFVNPGDGAVLFDPTSPIFAIGLQHRRAHIRWVPTWSEAGRVRFAMDRFAKAMRGAKLIVLADPVNPTGCVFAAEDLEQVAFWARKNDVLIFQDASFDRWRAEPAKARLASLPHANRRILTCGSFAKSHGLVAARIGWLIGNRHLVGPCAAAMFLAAPFVPEICQRVAVQAMRSRQTAMAELRDELNARRDYVSECLQEMGLDPWESAGGFFVWTPTPQGIGGHEFAQSLLRTAGVLVNPGVPFGSSGTKFIRISYATEEGRIARRSRSSTSIRDARTGAWAAGRAVDSVNRSTTLQAAAPRRPPTRTTPRRP